MLKSLKQRFNEVRDYEKFRKGRDVRHIVNKNNEVPKDDYGYKRHINRSVNDKN